jgi:DNA mismatch endonuclease (patch repair protein)
MKTREQISYNMSRVRSSGSDIEVRLGKALWTAGIRYRKQYGRIPGKPDFVVVRAKVAVFCDSSFWHGRGWPESARQLRSNREFWVPKIERNVARDRQVGRMLKRMGWRVMRFWDDSIMRDAAGCASRVVAAVQARVTT